MKNKIIIVFFFVIISNLLNGHVSFAQTGREPNYDDYSDTQVGRDHFSRDQLMYYDGLLNEVYSGILKIYSDDTLFIKRLKIAQKAWIVFRDAHVVSKYGYTQDGLLDSAGILFSGCLAGELTDIIKNRIDELKVWFDGYDYKTGYLCPIEMENTVKTKEEVDKIKANMNKTKKSHK